MAQSRFTRWRECDDEKRGRVNRCREGVFNENCCQKSSVVVDVDPPTNLIIWLCVYLEAAIKSWFPIKIWAQKRRIGTVQGCGNDGRSIWHENG